MRNLSLNIRKPNHEIRLKFFNCVDLSVSKHTRPWFFLGELQEVASQSQKFQQCGLIRLRGKATQPFPQ